MSMEESNGVWDRSSLVEGSAVGKIYVWYYERIIRGVCKVFLETALVRARDTVFP